MDLEFCGAVFAGCGSPPALSTRSQDAALTSKFPPWSDVGGQGFPSDQRVNFGDLKDVGCGPPPARDAPPQIAAAQIASTVLGAFTHENVDFSTSVSGRPCAPVRPAQLTLLQERLRTLEEGPLKNKLRAEANVWLRQYRRDLLEWAVPPVRRKVRHRVKRIVVEGWETEDRQVMKEELA